MADSDPTPTPPLWRVMDDAMLQSNGTVEVDCGSLNVTMQLPSGEDWGAALNAVADAIKAQFGGPAASRDGMYWVAGWNDSQAVVRWLRAEAERARAGG